MPHRQLSTGRRKGGRFCPDDDALRWRSFDGAAGVLHKDPTGNWKSTCGWTDRGDGKVVAFSDCGSGRIDFGGVSGQRIAFDVREATFRSHGVALAGRLVMPKGKDKVPVVILLHGSEHDSALTHYFLQRMLPAEGMGAFVYDKRGTGKSGGHYTQDFSQLADDAVTALRKARELAGARLGRIGYQAGSQGGWVAPIAAKRASVDFAIVCFGLAVNVVDEDQDSVELQLREKGYSADDIASALAGASAAETVFASGFTRGFEDFDALRARYKSAPWYRDLRGDYTFFFLPHSEVELRAMRTQFSWGTPFYYDPMPTLRADQVPQLVDPRRGGLRGAKRQDTPTHRLADRDRKAVHPGLLSRRRARHDAVRDRRGWLASLDPLRPTGYFKMIRDFARDGRLQGNYGDAEVTTPSR